MMSMSQTILLIEDESSIADTICYSLKTEGFSCIWESLGQSALQVLKQQTIDLVILDIGLPDMSGLEVCKKIREDNQVPIIFLSARSDEIDRVVGLEIGADDYVTKPFSPRELTARVKVIFKRLAMLSPRVSLPADNHPQSVGAFVIDELKAQITYQQQRLHLTPYEYSILKAFLYHPERVFSRDQLMDYLGDSANASMDRVIDTHIKTLRAKLRALNPKDTSIKTHRSLGYSFCL